MKLILITGPTGSGKTTLSKKILKKFKNGVLLSTDDYYKTGIISKILSKFVKNYFDRKLSFNYKLLKKDFNFIVKNKKINHKYSYDFSNKTITKSLLKISNIEYIVIEGIFTIDLINDLNQFSFSFIKLKTNKESCMNRTINRDVSERGKNIKLAKRDFIKSWNFYHSKDLITKKITNEIILSKPTDINKVIKKIFKSNN